MGLKEARRLRELEKENSELKKLLADPLLKAGALEIALKKHLSPERQRERAAVVRSRLPCSGQSVCRWLGFNRSTLRYRSKPLPPKKRMDHSNISEATTAPSSSPERFRAGSVKTISKRSTSIRAALGKTAMPRALGAVSGSSASTENYSTP